MLHGLQPGPCASEGRGVLHGPGACCSEVTTCAPVCCMACRQAPMAATPRVCAAWKPECPAARARTQRVVDEGKQPGSAPLNLLLVRLLACSFLLLPAALHVLLAPRPLPAPFAPLATCNHTVPVSAHLSSHACSLPPTPALRSFFLSRVCSLNNACLLLSMQPGCCVPHRLQSRVVARQICHALKSHSWIYSQHPNTRAR